MWLRRLLLFLTILTIGPVLTAQASQSTRPQTATLPTDFSESLIVPLDSLTRPTNFAIAPDGRVFITFQGDAAHGGGAVMVYDDDTETLLPDPLIVVPTNYQNEHGLLGITFDPAFATNGYIYLYYTTVNANPQLSVHRISRFTVVGNTASLASEVILLETSPIGTAEWHHGGEMQFGPDGMLYIGFGDNLNRPRSANATSLPHNAQELDTLFGKIARIDPRDGADPDNLPDTLIPPSNPFYATATGSPNNRAIYIRGVRHPYKIDFRPTDNKILFIDVGNSTAEEINELSSGANYGWPQTEGDFTQGSFPTFTRPVYNYLHSGSSANSGCAITAGAFYNPPVRMFPVSYVGKFFFAEYCNAWMKTFDTSTGTATSFATSSEDNVIGIEFTPTDGSMYYLIRNRPGGVGVPSDNDTGHIYHVIYTGVRPPAMKIHPQDQTQSLTQVATFTCNASANPAPTYKWQRDTVDIPGATQSSYTTPALTLGDNGAAFRCVATNTEGSATSNSAILTVLNNMPPVPTLSSPKATLLYKGGQKITFSGKATDPEDGALPASAFKWSVAFQHNTHAHPFMAETSGIKKGKFTIANAAHGSTEVWYRVYMTVTDSAGASTTTFVDIMPKVANITVQTNVAGLTYNINADTHTTPTSWDEVAGIIHQISAPPLQMFGGSIYQFDKWSDGKAAAHDISAPTKDTVYTATYSLIDAENGSFETANNKGIPTGWAGSNLVTADGQDCTQASAGTCSATLVGGAKIKTLKQTVPLEGLAGDDLTLNFGAHTTGATGFLVRVILYQKDGAKQTQDFALSGTSAWGAKTLNVVVAEPFTKLEIQFIGNVGATGQAWIDALHLVLN